MNLIRLSIGCGVGAVVGFGYHLLMKAIGSS